MCSTSWKPSPLKRRRRRFFRFLSVSPSISWSSKNHPEVWKVLCPKVVTTSEEKFNDQKHTIRPWDRNMMEMLYNKLKNQRLEPKNWWIIGSMLNLLFLKRRYIFSGEPAASFQGLVSSPKLTAKAPENWWLEDDLFLLGYHLFKCYMGVSKNRGTPKWMVQIMENLLKMDDLGG